MSSIQKLLASLFLLLSCSIQLDADYMPVRSQGCRNLIDDLKLVSDLDGCLCDRFPVTYNHFIIPGHIILPSARMQDNGYIAFGYSHHPPYRNYNLLVQPLERLELSLNYRIFRGIPDPVLTPMGFGDFSDKGANWKFAIALPEHSDYVLPGIAVGMEDFHGTRGFKSAFVVATQVFIDWDLEVSLGWGQDRLHGLWGGVNYMPFRQSCQPYLEGISLSAEYDPVDYANPQIEKHSGGRTQTWKFNYGLKYRLWEMFDFSAAYIRGEKWAFSGTMSYNFGDFQGMLPKTQDPLRYRSPVNIEPIGSRRPESVLATDFAFAFREQGFRLLQADLEEACCGDRILWFRISNERYRSEHCVRSRLYSLVAALTPLNVDIVRVSLQVSGMPAQTYHFRREMLERYRSCDLSECELAILSPMTEAQYPPSEALCLFRQGRPGFGWSLSPRWRTFFGSSTGKFKYSVGPTVSMRGVFCDYLDYKAQISYDSISNLKDCKDVDVLNPSQIINVRSDVVGYYQSDEPYFEELYIQKNWTLGRGCYGRLSAGYFELMYGGLAGELLYFPVCSNWAVGAELAVFQKRNHTGLKFQSKVRRLTGFSQSYLDHLPWQGFVYFYYDCRPLDMDLKLTAGSFLAHDLGLRTEVSRYFSNGFRLSAWYTWTDAHDVLNGARYHDKGISFSMPLDFFHRCSRKDFWGYGMSAWLRDVGQSANSGDGLLGIIGSERH